MAIEVCEVWKCNDFLTYLLVHFLFFDFIERDCIRTRVVIKRCLDGSGSVCFSNAYDGTTVNDAIVNCQKVESILNGFIRLFLAVGINTILEMWTILFIYFLKIFPLTDIQY